MLVFLRHTADTALSTTDLTTTGEDHARFNFTGRYSPRRLCVFNVATHGADGSGFAVRFS